MLGAPTIKRWVQKLAFATALQVHLWLWSQLADKLFVPHGDFLFFFWILVSKIKFASGLLDFGGLSPSLHDPPGLNKHRSMHKHL